MSRIVLHIDRLVLDGIDRCDARELAEGLESGLRRLLADPALADALAADADRVELGRQQLALDESLSRVPGGR